MNHLFSFKKFHMLSFFHIMYLFTTLFFSSLFFFIELFDYRLYIISKYRIIFEEIWPQLQLAISMITYCLWVDKRSMHTIKLCLEKLMPGTIIRLKEKMMWSFQEIFASNVTPKWFKQASNGCWHAETTSHKMMQFVECNTTVFEKYSFFPSVIVSFRGNNQNHFFCGCRVCYSV